jgi:hypothetical protein
MDLLERLDIKQPPGTMATTEEGALAASKKCAAPEVHRRLVLLPLCLPDPCRVQRDDVCSCSCGVLVQTREFNQ